MEQFSDGPSAQSDSNINSLSDLINHKIKEVSQHPSLRWRSLGESLSSLEKDQLMTCVFTSLVDAMGIEQFAKTPGAILEQIACSALERNEPIEAIIQAAHKAALIAYANPSTSQQAADHLTSLSQLANDTDKAISAAPTHSVH